MKLFGGAPQKPPLSPPKSLPNRIIQISSSSPNGYFQHISQALKPSATQTSFQVFFRNFVLLQIEPQGVFWDETERNRRNKPERI